MEEPIQVKSNATIFHGAFSQIDCFADLAHKLFFRFSSDVGVTVLVQKQHYKDKIQR